MAEMSQCIIPHDGSYLQSVNLDKVIFAATVEYEDRIFFHRHYSILSNGEYSSHRC